MVIQGVLMVTTLMGQPGDDERNEEITRGIHEFEELLREQAEKVRVQEVGRSVMAIVDRGFHRSTGRIVGSGFVMPKPSRMQEVSPGVYYLN